MTEPLFYTNSYLKEVKAKVVAIKHGAAVLDKTVFYPGGGCQPAADGKLLFQGYVARIAKVKRVGENILHWLDGPLPGSGTIHENKEPGK